MSGLYVIDNTLPTGGSNFNNFTDAVNSLNTSGVSGPVAYRILTGLSRMRGGLICLYTTGILFLNGYVKGMDIIFVTGEIN